MEYNNILVVFLVLNALFWGLFPHSTHCNAVAHIMGGACPSHTIHITLGVAMFLLAVYYTQRNYF